MQVEKYFQTDLKNRFQIPSPETVSTKPKSKLYRKKVTHMSHIKLYGDGQTLTSTLSPKSE